MTLIAKCQHDATEVGDNTKFHTRASKLSSEFILRR